MHKENKALWGIHGSHLDCPILNHRWFLGIPWSHPGSTVVARWCPGAALLRQRMPDPLTTTRSCRSHPVTGHVPNWPLNPGRNELKTMVMENDWKWWKMRENVEPMLKKGLYLSVLNWWLVFLSLFWGFSFSLCTVMGLSWSIHHPSMFS